MPQVNHGRFGLSRETVCSMIEAGSNTVLNQYLREKRKEGFYCYYELKVARGDTFYFSNIETNQHESLPALANEGLVWKLSDEDSRRKPCDGLSAPPLPSFLVIKFKGTYCFIEYHRILEMMNAGSTSISSDEAIEISQRIFRSSV